MDGDKPCKTDDKALMDAVEILDKYGWSDPRNDSDEYVKDRNFIYMTQESVRYVK